MGKTSRLPIHIVGAILFGGAIVAALSGCNKGEEINPAEFQAQQADARKLAEQDLKKSGGKIPSNGVLPGSKKTP